MSHPLIDRLTRDLGWRKEQLRALDRLLSEKTGLPVTISDDPLSAVANGTGAVLNDLNWVMQNL